MTAGQIQDTPFRSLLAGIYGAVASLRNSLYDRNLFPSHKVALPVICLGNAVAGGSGKSPMARAFIELLLKENRHPVLLLRGYQGKEKGPTVVSERSTTEDVGDEAVMHHRYFFRNRLEVPVVVARDRVAGAQFIQSSSLGDCIVLDDGFQHRRLARDLNVLLVDPTSFISHGPFTEKMLPAGRLREPFAQALARADLTIMVERSWEKGKQPSLRSALHVAIEPVKIFEVGSGIVHPLSMIAGKQVLLVSSISQPKQFESLVTEIGAQVVEHCELSDHEQISDEKWKGLLEKGIPVVTTEKDAAKLTVGNAPVYVVEIAGKLDGGPATRIRELLQRVVA